MKASILANGHQSLYVRGEILLFELTPKNAFKECLKKSIMQSAFYVHSSVVGYTKSNFRCEYSRSIRVEYHAPAKRPRVPVAQGILCPKNTMVMWYKPSSLIRQDYCEVIENCHSHYTINIFCLEFLYNVKHLQRIINM